MGTYGSSCEVEPWVERDSARRGGWSLRVGVEFAPLALRIFCRL